ncbi:MAG: type II toxin-antitoxin system RelE/ParE family toxin [Methylocystis sp.]|nr:type II toxin-antitoxin system RelE/ParE family toxin [Methylocystis sp.]MCA3584298.1 type II toxin-antitoxin system RelE/ParE family toxin [Methylocystis sp.]MCA3588330.1 type II toxin-antitoxin system RelE/ParE family toxin [Methylocystis sp.]MCA3590917.1 type II toxin-antitoxin system RelE/ParE family toxin [Methylocystis sp.]
MAFRLTRKAEEDIIGLFLEGARLFGPVQAERYHRELEQVFEMIGSHPQMARERREIKPPVRIHPHKAHLIVYIVEADGAALILRVRHGREDWVAGGSN